MADSSSKSPAPKPPSSNDPLTVERTVKFLWEQKRLQNFRRKANLKKLKAAEAEVKDAEHKVKGFIVRLDREFDAHPDVFKKMGFSRGNQESEGGEDGEKLS